MNSTEKVSAFIKNILWEKDNERTCMVMKCDRGEGPENKGVET